MSPPISIRRINGYDGKTVRYHFRSHKTESVEEEQVDVYPFIGRMIQHILPCLCDARRQAKGFKRIRSYGVQATKTFEQVKGIIQEALSRVKKVVKGAIKILAQKRYRERYMESTGNDPFICSHCGQEMDICTIWRPRYGVIYDELEEIRRGKYEQKEKEAFGEEGNGRAIRSSSEGVELPLFSMWN